MKVGLYKGFSSYQFEYNKSFKLLDVELVKRDLMNHIFTRIGERVYMPLWGTRIPDLLFEPLNEDSIGIVENDLTTVFEYDPRVELVELNVIPLYDQNAIIATALLNYIELDLQDLFELRLEFDQ
jgi:phage baseplate assembly protein W